MLFLLARTQDCGLGLSTYSTVATERYAVSSKVKPPGSPLHRQIIVAKILASAVNWRRWEGPRLKIVCVTQLASSRLFFCSYWTSACILAGQALSGRPDAGALFTKVSIAASHACKLGIFRLECSHRHVQTCSKASQHLGRAKLFSALSAECFLNWVLQQHKIRMKECLPKAFL